jgi:hypothetical protein
LAHTPPAAREEAIFEKAEFHSVQLRGSLAGKDREQEEAVPKRTVLAQSEEDWPTAVSPSGGKRGMRYEFI